MYLQQYDTGRGFLVGNTLGNASFSTAVILLYFSGHLEVCTGRGFVSGAWFNIDPLMYAHLAVQSLYTPPTPPCSAGRATRARFPLSKVDLNVRPFTTVVILPGPLQHPLPFGTADDE